MRKTYLKKEIVFWFDIISEAIANMDDDYIMLDIYENIQDEVKAVSKQLAIEKRKVFISKFTLFFLTT